MQSIRNNSISNNLMPSLTKEFSLGELLEDVNFPVELTKLKVKALNSFISVVKGFFGYKMNSNYQQLVNERSDANKPLGTQMPSNIDCLHLYLPVFSLKLGTHQL